MGEMDTSALRLVLAQLQPSGRNALRHLLANAATPLSMAVELANGAEGARELWESYEEAHYAGRGAADKLRRMVEAIDSHRPAPVRGSADEECETWDGCANASNR